MYVMKPAECFGAGLMFQRSAGSMRTSTGRFAYLSYIVYASASCFTLQPIGGSI